MKTAYLAAKINASVGSTQRDLDLVSAPGPTDAEVADANFGIVLADVTLVDCLRCWV